MKKTKAKAPAISFDDLPLVVESFKPKQHKGIIALLIELDRLTDEQENARNRIEEIKERLEELQTEAGVPGFQQDGLCFVSRTMPGRETLDKFLLIENGVKPSLIAKCMKTGKPYIERRFSNKSK